MVAPAAKKARTCGGGAWSQALQTGLTRWCDVGAVEQKFGVEVMRFRPRCPLLFLSGATPGPFYHSHPHIPAEFDDVKFDMASQTCTNIETIRKIGHAVKDYATELPFQLTEDMDWCRNPAILHWVSNNGDGFSSNNKVVQEMTTHALVKEGMEGAQMLGTFEVGDNVSDRRFLLETFAMYGLEGHPLGAEKGTVRIDIRSEFDAKFFMPYVPGYMHAGPSDLILFSLTAASGEQTAPTDGTKQVDLLLDKLLQLLASFGSTFDDVIVAWNRVPDLNADEKAVLMARSEKGLHRPLAESVLGLAESDMIGTASDGTPLAIEYIVVAQAPRQ